MLIIGELNFEDVLFEIVMVDILLYGEGFGFDFIDILEIVLLILKKYGFELCLDNLDNQIIFVMFGVLVVYVVVYCMK